MYLVSRESYLVKKLVFKSPNCFRILLSLRGEAAAIPFNRKQYYVYIMTNKINNVLYTGVTRNLKKRILEHKEKVIDGKICMTSYKTCHCK
jgi:hypothetical protein